MTDPIYLEEADYSDKRINHIILSHWEDIRGERRFPSEVDLNPEVLESVLDNSFLVQTEGVEDGKFNYKFLGKNIMNAYGSDLTKCFDYSKGNPLAYSNKIEHIMITGEPISDEGEFINAQGDRLKYRQCLVPLSSDGVHVDSVLGGMRFKIFAKD